MIEYQFRVWDKGFKRFLYFSPFADNFASDEYYQMWDRDTTVDIFTNMFTEDGVRIFTGDIIEFTAPILNGVKLIMEVKFIRGMFCVAIDNNPLPLEDAENSHIVGNVYENPEILLNKKYDIRRS